MVTLLPSLVHLPLMVLLASIMVAVPSLLSWKVSFPKPARLSLPFQVVPAREGRIGAVERALPVYSSIQCSRLAACMDARGSRARGPLLAISSSILRRKFLLEPQCFI